MTQNVLKMINGLEGFGKVDSILTTSNILLSLGAHLVDQIGVARREGEREHREDQVEEQRRTVPQRRDLGRRARFEQVEERADGLHDRGLRGVVARPMQQVKSMILCVFFTVWQGRHACTRLKLLRF